MKTSYALKEMVQDLPTGETDILRGGVMYTLNSVEVHCVCYSIGAYNSKAWESDNPTSGIHEIQVSRTLDAINCGYPGCYQGGVAIIEIHKP
jgi:hypothetical protein